MTTTTKLSFPKTTDPDAKAVHLLDTATMLQLYNAGMVPTVPRTTLDADVKFYIDETAKRAGWRAIEFVGDTAILKSAAPTMAGAAEQKPASSTKSSTRAATGANTSPFPRGQTPQVQHIDERGFTADKSIGRHW